MIALSEDEDRELSELGIAFTADSMRLRRLSWMTEQQWTLVRTEMTAWWKVEVIEPLVARRVAATGEDAEALRERFTQIEVVR